MVFTGTFEHTIDAKQRVAIASELRAELQRNTGQGEGDPIVLYITPGENQCLNLYPEHVFQQLAAQLEASDLDTETLLLYQRMWFSQSRRVELDKQGRVRLPEHLMSKVGLTPSSEVVLLGVGDSLEIWDREAWNTEMERVNREQPKVIINPLRAIRPKRATNTQTNSSGEAA